MKRILFVNKQMPLGSGGGKQITELANGFCERGFKVAVLVFDSEGTRGARMKELNSEVEIISPHGNYIKPFILGGPHEMIKAVRRWKPDILCSLLWGSKSVTAIVGKLLGVKVVLGVVGSDMYDTERKRFITLTRLFRGGVYRLASTVIAVSQGLARETRDVFGLKDVKTVYNGVDIENIRARSDGEIPHEYFRGDLPVLVSVGRLEPPKGYEYLLEAFGIVNETTEARLLMVGDGRLRDKLAHVAKVLGVHDKVAMVGETEPYAYMRHGDILVHSSVSEGFPIVLVEALALGMSIVATDCDHGPRELIENEKNGLLVPVADPEKMASAIIRLIRDKELRLNLATEAKKHSVRFTRNEMVSGYERIFMNI